MASVSASASAFSLSKEQADAIVKKHIATQVKPVVWSVTEIESKGYRYVLHVYALSSIISLAVTIF